MFQHIRERQEAVLETKKGTSLYGFNIRCSSKVLDTLPPAAHSTTV